VDPRDRLVTHPREAAFTLLGINDSDAIAADCQRRLSGEPGPRVSAADDRYGTYYAAAFRIDTAAGEPAVLYTGWTKEDDGAWRIFAYDVTEP
jgi:hypothetical protein